MIRVSFVNHRDKVLVFLGERGGGGGCVTVVLCVFVSAYRAHPQQQPIKTESRKNEERGGGREGPIIFGGKIQSNCRRTCPPYLSQKEKTKGKKALRRKMGIVEDIRFDAGNLYCWWRNRNAFSFRKLGISMGRLID